MVQKSSHKHLEQQNRELEKQSGKSPQRPEKFLKSDALFRSLFENGPEAMVVIDAETGKFVDANTNASRLFKLAREKLIGIGPLDISPIKQPDGRASKKAVQEKIQELLNENPEPFEWVHRDASGHDLLCEIRHSKLPITGRKLYCAIAIDITGRRKKEIEINQYKQIIESARNPIGLVDRNFIYQYVNEPYCQAFKKSAHEIIGYSVPELFGRNFFETVMESHYKQCFAGENVNYQEWFNFPGWGRRYMDVRYYPLQETGGRVVAVVTNVHDITENKLAEQTLTEQLGFERLIADIAAQLAQTRPGQLEVAINSTLQALGQFLHTERAFLARFLEDDNKLVFTNIWAAEGINPRSVIFEMDMVSEIPWVIQQIRKGEVIKAGPGLTGLPREAQKLRSQLERDGISSGLVVPVQVEGKSIGMLGLDTIDQARDYAQSILSRLRILADIIGSTLHRIQIQTKLLESEKQFRAFMDNNPAAIYIKDENDIHLYCNKFAAGAVGMEPEDFIGSRTHDLFPPKEADHLLEIDRKVLSENVDKLTDEYSYTAKGEIRWFRDTKFPIKLESAKRLIGGIAIDITESKQAEQALAEQLEFERLIADIAAQLAQTKPEQLEVSIDSTLQVLGQFFKTQRAFFSQFTDNGKSLYHKIIWSAEGIEVPSFFFELDMAAASPWFAQQIRNGKIINTGPGLVNLPVESGDLRERLRREGISSGVVVPVLVEGRSIGMIGLDTVDQPREYSQAIEDRLRILADMIGSMLRRVQTQEALQGSLKEVEQLKDRLEQENIYLREEIEIQHRHGEIIGKSKPLIEMLSLAEQVAETESTVLILGETGTGKELLAQAIHMLSPRKNRQMIKVNCAALPATLIESELFGREKGAYTGAMTRQIGRFEIADGSTIFLDEIGDLPLELQTKLLRVLQEGQFERLGNPKTISINARIIASTNQDLAKAVTEGKFREDLYYRLNVFSITVPPLRNRIEDLPLLIWGFVKEFEKSMGKTIEIIPRKNIDAMLKYSWPGNIRELRNNIENAMILSKNKILKPMPRSDPDLNIIKDLRLEVIERNHIVDVLKKTSWRVSGEKGAAKLLGLKPTTLESRMKKLGITRPK